MKIIEQAYQEIRSLGIKFRLLEGEFSFINTREKPDLDVLFFEVSEKELLEQLQIKGIGRSSMVHLVGLVARGHQSPAPRAP